MSQQRQALVVGISKYVKFPELYVSFPELKGASIDANNIAEILRNRGGFSKIKRLPNNPDDQRDAQSKQKSANQNLVAQEDLRDEIESLFKPDGNTIPDIILFYFSGHGYRDGQGNCYLCPSNSAVTKTEITNVISLDWLGELINGCPVKQQVIWLDCCYSGELLNTINHEQEGVNRFVITACDRNETAREDPTKGGALTQLLLEGLKVESHGENCQIVDSQRLEQWIKREIEKSSIKQELPIDQQPQIYQDPNTKIYLTVKEKIPGVDLEDHGRDPYKSLDFFTENDERIFCGRDVETQSLIDCWPEHRFVAITGASGVGKSSLLRAGLLYRLKNEERSKNWGYIELINLKTNPFSRLLTAINEFINFQTNQSESQEASVLNQEIEKDPKQLVDKLASVSNSNPIVLVIDQFEECFHTNNDVEREAFFRLLKELMQRDTLPLYLVIGMRSHFFENALKEKNITLYNALCRKEIDFLKEEKLKEAIKKPAEKVGLKIDEELQIEIFSDFEQSSALMEYTLAELTKYHKDWAVENQKDWYFYPITLNAYRDFQEKIKPLNSLGHQCYNALSVTEKPIAKYILLKLIRINVNDNKNKPKPRTRTSDQLACLRFPSDIIGYVRKKLADGRIITINTDSPGKIKFSLSHKDLITQWGDFGNWITDHQEDIISVCDLEQKAESWKSSGQKKGLLSNHDLKNYDQNQNKQRILFLLNQLTKDFISESEKKIKKNRQRWILGGGITIVVILGACLYAWDSSERTRRAEQSERTQTKESSELLEDFNTDTIKDIEASITVGRTLKKYDQKFSPEEQGQIISSLYDTVIGRSDQRFRMSDRLEFPDKINRVSVSPDNSYIALATKEKVILRKIVHDPSQKDNDELNLFQNDEVKSVSFSPDGKTIATGSNGAIVLWQCEANNSKVKISTCAFGHDKQYPIAVLKKIILPTDEWVNSVSFNFDGTILASASFEEVKIWRCKAYKKDLISNCANNTNDLDGNNLVRHEKGEKVGWFNDVSFAHLPDNTPSPYNNFLASADEKGFVWVWKLNNDITKSELLTKDKVDKDDNKINTSFPVNKVSFAVQNKILKLAAASKEKINIWMMRDPSSKLVSCFELQHDKWAKKGGAYINSVSFSSDGKRLISGGQDKIVKIWNTNVDDLEDSDQCLQNGDKKNLPKSDQPDALMQTLLLEGDAKDINFYGIYGNSKPYTFVSASYKDRGIVKLWKEVKIGESIGLNTPKFEILSSSSSINHNKNNSSQGTNSLPLFIKSFSYDVSTVFLSTDGLQVAAIQDTPKSALSVWNNQFPIFKRIYNNTLKLNGKLEQYLSITSNKFTKDKSEFLRVAILFQKLKNNDPYQQNIRLYDIPIHELNTLTNEEFSKKETIRMDNEKLNLRKERKIKPELMLLSPDAKFLATLSEYKNRKCNNNSNSQQILIWPLEEKNLLGSDQNKDLYLCKNNAKYRSFSFSSDSEFFAFLKEEDKPENETNSEGKKSKLIVLKKDKNSQKFNIPTNIPVLENNPEYDPKAFAFDPNDKSTFLMLGENSNRKKILKITKVNLDTQKPSQKVDLNFDGIPCDDDAPLIQYSTNNSNKLLAVACRNIIYLFDVNANKLTIKNILPHGAKVAKFSFNDTRLISVDSDKKLYYWNFEKSITEQFYLKLNEFACRYLLNNRKYSNTDNKCSD